MRCRGKLSFYCLKWDPVLMHFHTAQSTMPKMVKEKLETLPGGIGKGRPSIKVTKWQNLASSQSQLTVLKSSTAEAKSTHLSITPPESPLRPRLGAKASSSSKKIMQGAAALALANTKRKETNTNSC